MRFLGFFGLGLSLFLAGGGGRAEEAGLMSMHGDGKVWNNSFRMAMRADESPSEMHYTPSAAQTGNSVFSAKPPAGNIAGGAYLEWKNACLTPTTSSAGLILDRECFFGFRLVAPFLATPPDPDRGYIELLAENLSEG